MSQIIKKSGKIEDLSKQTILIYGPPKIGKSTFCSQFEDPLFIATESGLNYVVVNKINCPSWARFLEICKDLKDGQIKIEGTDGKEVLPKTIVIDTIDNLVTFCTEFICSREKIQHPSDYDYGKGWSMITGELKRVIAKLSLLPYGLIMTSHGKSEEIKTKTKTYNKETLSITGENRRAILGLVDIILFITHEKEIDKEVRVIKTKPSLYWDAGDRSGKIPAQLPLDYKEFSKYFNNSKEV